MSLPQLFDGELSLEFVRLIEAASRRVWIEVPWWRHRETPGPAKIFEAVVRSAKRGCDVRVLIRNEGSNTPTTEALNGAEVSVHTIRYLHEKCLIVDDQVVHHSANFTEKELHRNRNSGHVLVDPDILRSACFRFDDLWNADSSEVEQGEEIARFARDLLPPELVPYLTLHPKLNPCQAKVVPIVVGGDKNVVLTARTGAGKTLVGQVAVLRSIVQQNRRAVWLSPSVALTSELAKSFEAWRSLGVRVARLTGEMDLDHESARNAQLWVATTEKFESVCRGTSLAQEVAEIGCVVVDEIHLVGQENRGPTLEGLLARLRMLAGQTRIVGLSATLDNLKELAEWLNAEPVESAWRPVHTTYQVVEYRSGSSSQQRERSIDETLKPIVDEFRNDDGQVLVFCGSKFKADRTAKLLAGLEDRGVEGDALARRCRHQGVGLHYRGLRDNEATLSAFRDGEIRVLVATSGLAQGVNLPARAVIIRDNTLGSSPLGVDDAMQMMGRAGRVGQEKEGHAFLLVPESEAASWGTRLADGHHVDSPILDRLDDHILADVMLKRISSASELRRWYEGTLDFHQGKSGQEELENAVAVLLEEGFVRLESDGDSLSCTELGRTTSKFMVEVGCAAMLRRALGHLPWPGGTSDADLGEMAVITAMCQCLAVNQGLNGTKKLEEEIRDYLSGTEYTLLLDRDDWTPGSLKLLLVIYLALLNPEELRKRSGYIASIRVPDLVQSALELPRYFGWLGAAGRSSDFDWTSPIAADVGLRLQYWRAQPARGSGRLIRALEARTSPADRARELPKLIRRYRRSGVGCPEDLMDNVGSTRTRNRRNGNNSSALVSIRSVSASVDCSRIEVSLDAEPHDLSLVLRFCAGGEASLLRSASWTGEPFLVDLPPGAEAGKVACDVIGYGRSDWCHASTVLDLGGQLEEAFAHALTTWASRLPREVDHAEPRSWIPMPGFLSERRRRARARRMLHKDAHRLRRLAEQIVGAGDNKQRLYRLFDRTSSMIPISDRDSTRRPTRVLRSAILDGEHASSLEQALATAYLARSLEFDAEIVVFAQSGGFSAAVMDAGVWMLPPNCPDEEITFYTGFAGRQDVEILPQPEPVEQRPVEPAWRGLEAFHSVQPVSAPRPSGLPRVETPSAPAEEHDRSSYPVETEPSESVAADAVPRLMGAGGRNRASRDSGQVHCSGDAALEDMTPYELGELATPATVPLLVRFLRTGSKNERRLAASTIGKVAKLHLVEARAAYRALIACVEEDDYPQLRQYALKAISILGIEREDVPLVRHIAEHDDKEYNRESAKRLLSNL